VQRLPVGRGTLLATTFPLAGQLGDNPLATTLFHSLVSDLNS
jgi:hypothetical protein